MEYLLLVAGLAILVFGAEILVKGAVAIAHKFRVSMLVIGMTIVSFGTSAPELLVSLKAALGGHQDIGVGAVIGSNISNIALILGLTAMILPIKVQRDSIRIDWPMMMMASIAFYLAILDEWLKFWEGALFFITLFVFGAWLINHSRKNNEIQIEQEEIASKLGNVEFMIRNFVLIVLGVLGLVYGSEFLLDGAVQIARNFEIPERIIGLTLIAFGTSVPELMTSVVAAYRRKSDISIGNLIGSNLFNLLGILGITAMVKDIHIDQNIISFDAIWMLAISALIFPLMFFGKKINRIKGLLLFSAYFTYVYFVIFQKAA